MKTLFLTIFLSSISISTLAADEDVIFNRKATNAQRNEVSKTLSQENNPPLPMHAAIAEVCYEADICAQAKDGDDIPDSCEENDSEDEISVEDTCFPELMRKKYSCNPDLKKLNRHSLKILGRAIQDSSSMYNSIFVDVMMKSLGKRINSTNMCMANLSVEDYENLKKKYPVLMAEYELMGNEAPALGQYTMDCYEKMNPILFSGDHNKLRRYFNLYKSTLNAMSILPQFKGKVNRGVRLPSAVLARHNVGSKVCYNGFTSTAVHIPADYGNKPRNYFLNDTCAQRMYITQPATGVVHGRLIGEASGSKGENEVLFEPGACFRVDKITPRTDKNPEDDGTEVCEPGERVNIEMTLL